MFSLSISLKSSHRHEKCVVRVHSYDNDCDTVFVRDIDRGKVSEFVSFEQEKELKFT